MELASCHPSGVYNFETTPRSLQNLCNPILNDLSPWYLTKS